MENRHWRWLGFIFATFMIFSIGYGTGFEHGSRATFDFFISAVNYAVENKIIKMEVSSEQFKKFLELAQTYCYRNSQGSGSLNAGKIDCGAY